jgi:hypothetical protein
MKNNRANFDHFRDIIYYCKCCLAKYARKRGVRFRGSPMRVFSAAESASHPFFKNKGASRKIPVAESRVGFIRDISSLIAGITAGYVKVAFLCPDDAGSYRACEGDDRSRLSDDLSCYHFAGLDLRYSD